MKTLKLFFLLLFIISSLHAQTWNTKIDYENTEYLGAKPGLLKLIDGNYLFLYWRLDEPPLNFNQWNHTLAKYDTEGELVWEKYYDHSESTFPFFGGLHPTGVIQVPDEKIVVVGKVRPDFEAYLYVTDKQGDSLLYRTYPEYYGFGNITWHDNNEIAVGALDTSNTSHILKIDIPSGDIVDEYQYVTGGGETFFPNNADHYFRYTPFSDSIRLEKYTYSGNLLMTNEIKAPEGFGIGQGLGDPVNQTLNEEGIIIYKNALLEIDNNLNPTLSIPFNENSLNITLSLDKHEAYYVLPTSDGGYLLSGSFNTLGGNFDEAQVFFIKVNEQGEEEWSKGFSNWDLPANYVPYILEEPDGYVFIRHAYFDGEIYLTKMTKSGDLVSTTDPIINNSLNIFPNPCSDYVKISISQKYRKGQLKIINAQGSLVDQQENISAGEHELRAGYLNPGVYFFQLTKKNLPILASKLVKM